MPYKRQGRTVYVKRGGRWVAETTHPTAAKAQAHVTALRINVEAKEKKKHHRKRRSGKHSTRTKTKRR